MKKTVHIVIENGCVIDAFADTDVDVVVYDLDCPDPEMKAEVQAAVDALATNYDEVEIL